MIQNFFRLIRRKVSLAKQGAVAFSTGRDRLRNPYNALPGTDPASMAATLMQSRQTILPKRLSAPGPDADQLRTILSAAASAPDHGQLLPWRFVLVPQSERGRLAEVFGAALLERDAAATPEQVAQAREKAHRSPLLLLVVVDGLCGDADIDLFERIISTGCAVQNMLLMATALGYGSALTSGKALKSAGLRTLFGLGQGEHALCFVSIGTVQSHKNARVRPEPGDYVSTLPAQGAGVPGLSSAGPRGPCRIFYHWMLFMTISSFDDLLQAAQAQPEPQRLLFVFVVAELPDDATAAQRQRFEAGQGGALVPLMCVDKRPDELASFAALAQEASQFGHVWDIVFAAALPGRLGRTPTSEDAEAPLQHMVEAIKRGDIGGYIAFDLQGHPVQIG